MTEVLDYRLEGSVAVLVFDDGKANALNDASIAALHQALDRAEREAGAALLVGRPERFSAGFDLAVMTSDAASARALLRTGVDLLMRIWEFPRPVVAACTGHAVAAGAMLLLVADYRIGLVGDWSIGLNEVAIGMPLPLFGVELARARLDPRCFSRATLHSELYDGSGAAQVGFLDEAVDPADLLDRALAKATEMAGLGPAGYLPSKQRVRRALAEHVRATLDEDLDAITMPQV